MSDDIKAALTALDAAIAGVAAVLKQHKSNDIDEAGPSGFAWERTEIAVERLRADARHLESEADYALWTQTDDFRAYCSRASAAAEARADAAAYRAAVL